MTIIHTSHHYLNVFIELVQANDTIEYHKTKPFGYFTPWWSNKNGAVLNPRIDELIYMMLSGKFLRRERLKLLDPKKG